MDDLHTLTVDDILGLLAWIERGPSEQIREDRTERVRRRLFPEGLEAEEVTRRQRLIERAREVEAEKRDAASDDPMPLRAALPSVSPAHEAVSAWEGLIPESSPAYRRAQLHDGTRTALEREKARAKGSPFDAEYDEFPVRTKPVSKKP